MRSGASSLAVVVGAGGIASAIASRLARTHHILIADRDPVALEREVDRLKSSGASAEGCLCDITVGATVKELAARAAASGPPCLLAHVVGVSPSMGDWAKIISVNLIGAALVADAFLPVLAKPSAGLFLASMAGHGFHLDAEQAALVDDPLQPGLADKLAATLSGEPSPEAAYSLSKAVLLRMCRRRAAEWGRRGARIVSLSPGMIESPMGLIEFRKQPLKQRMLSISPIPRQGTLDEIVDAAEFLLSDRASFITGTDLLVDGGVTAAIRAGSRTAIPAVRSQSPIP